MLVKPLKRPHDAKDENKITISNRLGLPMDEKDPIFISIFMKSMDTRIYPWILYVEIFYIENPYEKLPHSATVLNSIESIFLILEDLDHY